MVEHVRRSSIPMNDSVIYGSPNKTSLKVPPETISPGKKILFQVYWCSKPYITRSAGFAVSSFC